MYNNVTVGLLAHMHSKHSAVLDEITNKDQKIKGEIEEKLKSAIAEFANDFA